MVVAVLQGSVRSDRMGDRVAKWVLSQLEERGHETVLVDAAVLQLPLLDRMWKEIKQSPTPAERALVEKLRPLADLYLRADGFVVCSAEYNYFLEEYFYRPSAIVCYSAGPYGGVRAAMQLRALLAEAGMPTIPSLQPIPAVGQALSTEGLPLNQAMAEQTGKFFDEFDWYMGALRDARVKNDPRSK